MPLSLVTGDPLLTQAGYLAFGHNARGRAELGPLETALMQQYPAAFAAYQQRCRKGRMKAGEFWLWTETVPRLIFMVVRESSVGATRLRYVQSALLSLARDYPLHSIQSLALAPLGNAYEWPEVRLLVTRWLGNLSLPVTVYDEYRPGLRALEGA